MAYKFKAVAPCLEKLREQLNTINPNRDKVSDGGLGDAAHASRASDHNPDKDGIVCARDFTNNITRGIAGKELVKALTDNPDPRINYIIFDKKITVKGSNLQKWKEYNGANAHRHHVHISVFHDPKLRDSKKAWNLKGLEAPHTADIATVLPEGEHLSNPTGEPLKPPPTETIPDEKPVPYNGVGLQATLVNDAKTVVPSITFTQITDAISQASGLPPLFVKIFSILAILTIVFCALWLGYRLISYLVHSIREIIRVRTNKVINANPDLKNVAPPPPVDKDTK